MCLAIESATGMFGTRRSVSLQGVIGGCRFVGAQTFEMARPIPNDPLSHQNLAQIGRARFCVPKTRGSESGACPAPLGVTREAISFLLPFGRKARMAAVQQGRLAVGNELRCGSFRPRNFLFRLRLLLFELEADLSVLQLQVGREGTPLS